MNKAMAERRKVRPDCIYASNPFHECTDYCLRKTAESKTQKDKKYRGSFVLDLSNSFGRKKGSRPKPPKQPDIGRNSSTVSAEVPHIYPKKKIEPRKIDIISSARMHSEEIHQDYPSFSSDQLDSSRITSSESFMPNCQDDASKQSPTRTPPTKTTNYMIGDENYKRLFTNEVTPKANDTKEVARKPPSETSFSLSEVEQTLDDGDEVEVESVNSESCVSVGKYRVKSSFSSILMSILDKYGDIAATCKLESVSMRSYYLECVCYVIQELQSTEFQQLTKAKVKELLAIFKDVESSQMDVGWLKSRLSEILQTFELRSQQRTTEAEKANCEWNLESMKKELEAQMKDLEMKEKEVSDAKARVAETKARISELEVKFSELNEIVASTKREIESFRCELFLDDLL